MTTTLSQNTYLVKAIIEKIEEQLKAESEKADPIDILGNLAAPFSGMDAPALYSGGDDSSDKVLEALIIYFAKEENLKQLPKCVQSSTLSVISHLHSLMRVLSKYDPVIFDAVNLYNIKRLRSMPDIDLDDYANWYGVI